MIGKLSPDRLDRVFERLGAPNDAVVQGPAYGEDTAAVRVGDTTLVVNADPISLAADRVGTLGVHVACNDVAASGADPEWLTAVVFLPADRPETLDAVTAQLDEAARDAGVAIIGGHTEYSAELSRPTLALTCMGTTDRYVPTGGAQPGDRVLLTKGAAIEGTAILATDFRDELAGRVDEDLLDEAATYFGDVSVIRDAECVREHATAMHDPTEGGLVDGLLELAVASDVTLDVRSADVPLREPTRALCDAIGVDPFRIFGSGALLATVPEDAADAAVAALDDAGVQADVIGSVEDGPGRLLFDDEEFREPVRDDLYDLWE